jgi:hypothetical protein
MINMETKRTAIPLSREDRDNKKVKIDAEEFIAHVSSFLPPPKVVEVVEEVKKVKSKKVKK